MVAGRALRLRPFAAVALIAPSAIAQEPAGAANPAASPETDDTKSAFSLTLSATATTAYFFRGIKEEDQGAIVQPALELDVDAWHGDGFVKSASLALGSWNSLHSGPTGTGGTAAHSPKAWYESDFYATANLALDHGLSLAATWVAYTSPNTLFKTIDEVDVTIAWDDSDLWHGKFAIKPSLTLARELRNQAEQSSNPPGTHSGTFLGIGVAPTFTLCDLGDASKESCSIPITFSLPANAGFSLAHYYEDAAGRDDAFGFVDIGAMFSVPLTFVPQRFGKWTFSACAHVLFLGNTMKAGNGGDATQWIGTAGISLAF